MSDEIIVETTENNEDNDTNIVEMMQSVRDMLMRIDERITILENKLNEYIERNDDGISGSADTAGTADTPGTGEEEARAAEEKSIRPDRTHWYFRKLW